MCPSKFPYTSELLFLALMLKLLIPSTVDGEVMYNCGIPTVTPSSSRHSPSHLSFIINGTKSVSGRWPWMVKTDTDIPTYHCSSALVAPRWILTAAHCIDPALNPVLLR